MGRDNSSNSSFACLEDADNARLGPTEVLEEPPSLQSSSDGRSLTKKFSLWIRAASKSAFSGSGSTDQEREENCDSSKRNHHAVFDGNVVLDSTKQLQIISVGYGKTSRLGKPRGAKWVHRSREGQDLTKRIKHLKQN